MLNNLGWRWIVGVVGPVAAVTLVVRAIAVRPVGTRSSSPIDLLSVPLAVLGFGGLVYGLAGIGESADHAVAVPSWIPFVVGAVVLAAFVARQLLLARDGRALLDLRVFGSSTFSLTILAMVVAMATMMGTFIVVPYFAQTVLGFSPFTTGLVTLTGGLHGAGGTDHRAHLDLRGARPLVIPVAAAITAGVWSLSVVDGSTTVWWLIGANMMLCLGLAATFTPLVTLASGSVAFERYWHGSAALGTFQQVAGAVGTALFVTVMTVVARGDHATDDAAIDAIAHGVRTVFTVAGFLGILLVAIVCLIRPRPVVTAADPTVDAALTA